MMEKNWRNFRKQKNKLWRSGEYNHDKIKFSDCKF